MVEAVNVILAAVVVFSMIGTRSHGYILFLLFSYASLHFSFAALPLITGASMIDVAAIHLQGSGILAKLSGVTVLIALFIKLCCDFKLSIAVEKKIIHTFVAVLVAITIGGFLNLRPDDSMQIMNVIATLGMLLLMVLIAPHVDKFEWNMHRREMYFVLLMQLVMFAVAFYELYSLRTWASFINSNGEVIYRSSSLLFNPNIYGMWCSILAIAFSYLLHKNIGECWLILSGMTLAFGGLYLSGSRSASFLTLFLLVFIAMVIHKNILWRRWIPVLLMLSSFVALGFGSNWMSQLFFSKFDNWNAIYLLGERFFVYPMQFLGYLLNYFSMGIEIPNEIVISIEGRFSGELKDAGWLVLFNDTGWLGLIGVFGLWGVFLLWGINAYKIRRDTTSIYAIALLIFSVLCGAVMRFQVFPTWVFMAIILAPCITYWQLVLNGEQHKSKLQKIHR